MRKRKAVNMMTSLMPIPQHNESVWTSLMPIPQYNESVLDKERTNTRHAAIVYVDYIPERDKRIFDWTKHLAVEKAMSELVINKKFIAYVNKTNAKILQNVAKFEDMGQKYR